MATVRDVYKALDAFAPFGTQMDFDNAGFLVGRGERTVSRILVSLDITLPVIAEAQKLGAELIVSHHPIIFHPAKAIVSGDPTGDKLLALMEGKIAAICAHTNLDVAVNGVNDALAAAVGLKDTQVFLPDGLDAQGRPYGLGRIGVTEKPFTLIEYAKKIKHSLGANGVRYVDTERLICRVAVGGGACGEYLRAAFDRGCDAFVTADVKYDVFLEAKALGMGLIDAGHFPTENVVLPALVHALNTAFPEIETKATEVHREVFAYL